MHAHVVARVTPPGPVPAQDLPRLRALAEGMVSRRIGVWFCLGGAIAGLGIAVTDPTDPIQNPFETVF